MQNSKFKNFKTYIREFGFDEYICCSGYLWLSLTNRQLKEVAQIAINEKGYKVDNEGNLKINQWIIRKELMI